MFNGERLREVRKNNKLTQAETAKKINIERSTYVRYELGEITPPSDMVGLLADIFKVSTDWLLNKSDDPTPTNKKNTISPEKLKLLDGIGYAYFGREGKELDDEDVDHILEIVKLGREMGEKRKRDDAKK